MTRFSAIGRTAGPNYEVGGWATEGEQNNPLINAIFADTGQLAAGIYDFDIVLDSSIVLAARLQHRNAANGANIKEHDLVTNVTMNHVTFYIRGYKMAANERLRMISYAGYTGWVCGSIVWVRRV